MNTTLRGGAVVALVVLSAACGNSLPMSPTATNPPPTLATPAPPPATNLPPLSGPSRTFVFDRALSYGVRDYTTMSRYVLYENGAFVLEYTNSGGRYRGAYSEANGAVVFEWEGWSAAGPWGATGTLTGDSLTVQYNFIMQLTDFEDAVYALMR